MKKKKWHSGIQAYITSALFCVWIFGFAAAGIIKPSAEFSETENRVLAQMPKLTWETLIHGEFEKNYEEYLTDQFVWREHWIGIKTMVERALLRRESKDIYFADDKYLIEKHTGVFDSQTAKRNSTTLVQFAQQYAEIFGAEHMSVLLVPNAVDILTDKLPPFAACGKGSGYLAQIAEKLPDGIWMDAAPVLEAHREEEMYYRTDHHWKTLAAFYVYQAWAQQKGYRVPEPSDYKIETVTDCFEGTIQSKLGIHTDTDTIELFLPKQELSYTVQSSHSEEGGIYHYEALDTKDKYAVYFGGNEPFLKISTEQEKSSGRKILVIKDSYANCFLPFLIEEFQEIDVIDLRYTNQRLSERIAEGEYTDLLVLYNASGFAEDMSVIKLIN